MMIIFYNMPTFKIPDEYWNLWFIKPTPIYQIFSFGLKVDENGKIYEDVLTTVQINGQFVGYERLRVFDLKHSIKAKL